MSAPNESISVERAGRALVTLLTDARREDETGGQLSWEHVETALAPLIDDNEGATLARIMLVMKDLARFAACTLGVLESQGADVASILSDLDAAQADGPGRGNRGAAVAAPTESRLSGVERRALATALDLLDASRTTEGGFGIVRPLSRLTDDEHLAGVIEALAHFLGQALAALENEAGMDVEAWLMNVRYLPD